MNAVVQRMTELKLRNYVMKANSKNYQFNFSSGKIAEWRHATGDEFYIILHGSPEVEEDFFVIPYKVLKNVLTEDNLEERHKPNARIRWLGYISNNQFRINKRDINVDLTPYKGNLELLELAVDGLHEPINLSPEEDDSSDQGGTEEASYTKVDLTPNKGPLEPELAVDGVFEPIDLSPEEGDSTDQGGTEEASYTPEDGDWRTIVVRQIKARRGQQAFRNALRDRYTDLCLVSGCRLMDVVEAAHIKPYRGKPDNHPANGLLLRADLHTLFDLDLIGIEPETLIVRVHPSARAEGYGAYDGVMLKCNGAQPSEAALIVRWRAYQCKLGQVATLVPAAKT